MLVFQPLQPGGRDVVFERRPRFARAPVLGAAALSRICQSAMGFRLLYGAQNSRPEHGNTVRERRGRKGWPEPPRQTGRAVRGRGAKAAVKAQR